MEHLSQLRHGAFLLMTSFSIWAQMFRRPTGSNLKLKFIARTGCDFGVIPSSYHLWFYSGHMSSNMHLNISIFFVLLWQYWPFSVSILTRLSTTWCAHRCLAFSRCVILPLRTSRHHSTCALIFVCQSLVRLTFAALTLSRHTLDPLPSMATEICCIYIR